jgi:hypothetical protein
MNRLWWSLLAVAVALGIGVRAQGTEKDVTDAFLKYRAVYEKSQALEEILPYWSKARVADVEQTPAADRPAMFQLMKGFDDSTGYRVLSVSKTPAGNYRLGVEGRNKEGKRVTGIVQMKKESGKWKVDKEDYGG